MRTSSVRTRSLAGGMRGDRSGELQVIVPQPSLTTVLLGNLARITARVTVLAARHPFAILAVVLVWWVWAALGPYGAAVLPLVATVGLVTWRRWWPGSFRRVVVSRWRAMWLYRRQWQPAMVTCGLAQELHGREYLPRIRTVVSGECADRVQVELLSGQSPEDFERHALQLAHTFAVQRVRVVVDRPGRVWLEFTRRDALAETVAPDQTQGTPDLDALVLGRREDGAPWRLRLAGTHLLVAGATGSGKGSVVWSLIRAIGPCIREGSVQVWAIDPKGGMELSPGAGLFTRFAYGDPASMVTLLEDAVTFMRTRTERLRADGRRTHVPSPADPLVLVVVDELAALTAYVGDRDLKRRAEAALQLLLSQGRAPGVLVVAAVQDPGKDVIGFRDLFPSRIALRLLEDVQVDMVLGRSARHRGAECDQIPATLPGIGYVVLEGLREPVRVRAAHVSDAELARMVCDYRPGTAEGTTTPALTGDQPLRLVGEG